MPYDATHASFFSGVGGLDLGLERAGWRTVSFSEIDPYANAVLAERWPGVPNLGDITALADSCRRVWGEAAARLPDADCEVGGHNRSLRIGSGRDASGATLWSGGFPCQDLSVAGKRAGFAGERSGLAFAFLDLVERHRPPAILLENVPGLLSSHRGRDFGALLDRLGQLGYWWAYRILDARHFGVPQRRRRVFIVALNAERGFGPDSAAAVLSVGARCGGHSAAGDEAREGAARAVEPSVAFALRRDPGGTTGQGWNTNYHLSPSSDPGGVRAPDGLAGRLDDLSPTLRVGPARPQDGGPGDTVPIIVNAFDWQKGGNEGTERGRAYIARAGDYAGSLSASKHDAIYGNVGEAGPDQDLLPLGLDSHRYRCCGNGVVSNVSEWIGRQLLAAIERTSDAA